MSLIWKGCPLFVCLKEPLNLAPVQEEISLVVRWCLVNTPKDYRTFQRIVPTKPATPLKNPLSFFSLGSSYYGGSAEIII